MVRYSSILIPWVHQSRSTGWIYFVTFLPHGIIKGRHLVKSLDIRMAQISMKSVIFPWLVPSTTRIINLFISWNSVPSSLLSHQFADIQWLLNIPVSIFFIENFNFHWNFLNFYWKQQFSFENSNFFILRYWKCEFSAIT